MRVFAHKKLANLLPNPTHKKLFICNRHLDPMLSYILMSIYAKTSHAMCVF